MNGAGVIINCLKRHGIRHVFGVPGAQVGALMDGVSRDDFFSYIICRHEEVGAHMAHGVGRSDSQMALCFGTTGPGGTNMVSAVQSAAMDNIPMLVITANNPSNAVYPFKDYLQDSNNHQIFSAVAKFSERVSSSDRLEELLERAIYAARSGKPGPAHLDIPVDFLYHEVEQSARRYSCLLPTPPAPAPGALDRLVNLLSTSERPLFLVGGGALRSGAEESIQLLVERLQIPVTTTVNGRGAIRVGSPLVVGVGGLFGGIAYECALKEADLIVAVGCKFGSFSLLAKSEEFDVGHEQTLVHVDIDFEMIGKNVPVDLGVVADAKLFADALFDFLPDAFEGNWGNWRAYLEGRRTEHDLMIGDAMEEGDCPINALPQAKVIDVIEQILPDEAMVAIDGGQVAMWANTLLTPHDRLSAVYTPGTGHLGSGFPMAMGFALAHPDRPSVLVTGDGAFAFTAQDLATCHKYNIPVISVVLHDACWGIYNRFKGVFNNERWGSELSDVDFCKVAEGYGVLAVRISTLEQLADELQKALASGKPAVIEVPVIYQLNPVNKYLGPATMPDVRLGQAMMALTD